MLMIATPGEVPDAERDMDEERNYRNYKRL
jgi:hypothetical protein